MDLNIAFFKSLDAVEISKLHVSEAKLGEKKMSNEELKAKSLSS